METNTLAKQTLQLYYTALTRTLDAALAVQDNSKKTVDTLLDQTPGIPVEGKQVINDWLEVCREQTVAIKSVIDEGFKPLQSYYEE